MQQKPTLKSEQAILEKAKEQALSLRERGDLACDLAALILTRANAMRTPAEERKQKMLSKMMKDPLGKVFTVLIADQSFRAKSNKRSADQVRFLIDKYGIPSFASPLQKASLFTFKHLSVLFPSVSMFFFRKMLRQETKDVIIPSTRLKEHIDLRTKEGSRVNINHLGEAILGEIEAEHRLKTYLLDLKKPEIEYISVKISSICSQINLIAFDDTLEILAERLQRLYREAKKNKYIRVDGTSCSKFVNLDMEEYRDLGLTVSLFQKVLDLEEFQDLSAGIVLQAYLPDSFSIQKKLTEWAKARVAKGGAPIKIRIVKGANLATEKVEASIQNWQQAPFHEKIDADAQFKKMLNFGLSKENAKAVHIGIASHNIFDIAYGLVLRSENSVEDYVEFEMLEGMADHLKRAVIEVSGNMVLYCPVASDLSFVSAIAYLVRRLDENTSPENFLHTSFDIAPNTPSFEAQQKQFKASLEKIETLNESSNREENPFPLIFKSFFVNEPNTDWSLNESRESLYSKLATWSTLTHKTIPLVIDGMIRHKENVGAGVDPSFVNKKIYTYSLADHKDIEEAITSAKAVKSLSFDERAHRLYETANLFRKERYNLILAMMADAGKTPFEADVEVTEAIDFIEYYRMSQEDIISLAGLACSPLGTVLVAPPWNFPCAIPVGGIAAALAAGNSVIFKPASETMLVGWMLVNLFWDAGFDRKTLQFIGADDTPIGSLLIEDPRVDAIILTGSTETAKLFLKMRPGLNLLAETGGKNSIIVTALADRDLAIKDIVNSSFSHAGQKCSACSLLILEKEVYDDPHFLKQLSDAASSVGVGSVWDLSNKIGPLIRSPGATLLKGLTQLDEGEEWLLAPKQDAINPRIWTPGIKLGVKEGSFTHRTELFGPVLGVMRSENLESAISLANATSYGLTAGLHSLDVREKEIWEQKIQAGNLYVNRGITGAVVLRQPFGGCKDSSFGLGHKTGGPNYLFQLQKIEETSLPKDAGTIEFDRFINKDLLNEKEKALLAASFASYAFYYKNYFSKSHDLMRLLGQDNIMKYVPKESIHVRFDRWNDKVSLLQTLGALLLLDLPIDLSLDPSTSSQIQSLFPAEKIKKIHLHFESESDFCKRIEKDQIKWVRMFKEPSPLLNKSGSRVSSSFIKGPPFANGRVELLKYLRETSVSYDYHRYGNLAMKGD